MDISSDKVICPLFGLADENATVEWGASFTVPDAAVRRSFTPNGQVTITDTYNNITFVSSNLETMALDPNDASRWVKALTFAGTTPGKYRNPAPNLNWQIRDSVFTAVGNLKTEYTPAYAYTVRIGVVE